MAFNLTQMQAATDDYVVRMGGAKFAHDIVHRGSPGLFVLWKGKKFKEGILKPSDMTADGYRIRVPLLYAKGNRGGLGNDTELSVAYKNKFNVARFRQGGAYASDILTFNERRMNMGEKAIIKLGLAKIETIWGDLADTIALNLFFTAAEMAAYANANFNTGTYVAEDFFEGMGMNSSAGGMFDDTTSNEYGEVQESDMPEWEGNAVTATGTYYANFAGFEDVLEQGRVGDTMAGVPDVFLTTYDMVKAYKKSLSPQQQFGDVKEYTNVGFKAIMHDGEVPVLADSRVKIYQDYKSASYDYVYGLNTKWLALKTHPEFAMTTPKWTPVSAQRKLTLLADSEYSGAFVCGHRKAQVLFTGFQAA